MSTVPEDPHLCPDVQALLEDAERRPGDEMPRAVLADWLDENGEPDRAELLRLACRLAEPGVAEEERDVLRVREHELKEKLEESWLLPLGGTGSAWVIEGGVVVRASLELGVYLERWQEILDRSWARAVELFASRLDRESPLDLGRLATCPGLERVRRLELRNQYISPAELAPLLTSPHLRSLEKLDLAGNTLGTEGALLLASCPALSSLKGLALGGNLLGDDGLRALLQGGFLTHLRALDLASNSLTDGGLRALARCPHLAELRVLGLSHNALTSEGVAALLRSPHLRRLSALDLSGNFLDNDVLDHLAAWSRWASAEAVDLSNNPIDPDALRARALGLPCLAGARR